MSATPTDAETSFNGFPSYTPGDYFKFEFDAEAFIDAVGIELAGEDYEGSENVDVGTVEYRVTGEEAVTVDGTDYSCVIIDFSWDLSFTLKFEDGSTEFDDDRLSYEFEMNNRMWFVVENQTTVSSEESMSMVMRFKTDGDDHTLLMEEETKNTYLEVSGGSFQFPLKVGDTWSESATYISNITERTKMDNDDWETESYELEISESSEYEVLGENNVKVPAGRFQCLKIKDQDQWSSEYSICYYDRNGIPVKMVEYGPDGTLGMSLELNDFKMKNADVGTSDDDDDDFEIMGIDGYLFTGGSSLAAIAVLCGVLLFMRMRGEDEEGLCPDCWEEMDFIDEYDEWYCHSCENYNEPARARKPKPRKKAVRKRPPRKAAAGRQRKKTPKCRECRGPMSFISQYDKWYCYSCERYADPRPTQSAPTTGTAKAAVTNIRCPECGRTGKVKVVKRPLKIRCSGCGKGLVLR